MEFKTLKIGRKVFIICATCNRYVQLNKPIIGSMHFCLTEEEIEAKRIKE